MDFIDKIRSLADRVPNQLEYCQTEEATKNALIMPFINTLGYDVFDPTEVVPEFIADIGIKKGEKADYAIMIDGEPMILFECKWSGADLNKEHASQLHRYFNAVSSVRFGILTNGVIYRFYSDLDQPNIMDDKPFFEFSILDISERHVSELKKFTKSSFDIENIVDTASELKYTAAILKIIASDFEHPSEEFIRHYVDQVYSGVKTLKVITKFTPIVNKACRRFMNDQINQRLQSAIQKDEIKEPVPEPEDADEPDIKEEISPKREIVTTEEEIEGFFAVKSILRETVDLKRIHIRDKKTVCLILLDNNAHRPLCKLYFNSSQKYLGLIQDIKRSEQRVAILEVDDIYEYADQIISIAAQYDAA